MSEFVFFCPEDIPLVAIGGLKIDQHQELTHKYQVRDVVVISDILQSDAPLFKVEQWVKIINSCSNVLKH